MVEAAIKDKTDDLIEGLHSGYFAIPKEASANGFGPRLRGLREEGHEGVSEAFRDYASSHHLVI